MLKEYFDGINDPRQEGKVKHNLLEVIVMTICAVIAGCDVVFFGAARLFRGLCPEGTPGGRLLHHESGRDRKDSGGVSQV